MAIKDYLPDIGGYLKDKFAASVANAEAARQQLQQAQGVGQTVGAGIAGAAKVLGGGVIDVARTAAAPPIATVGFLGDIAKGAINPGATGGILPSSAAITAPAKTPVEAVRDTTQFPVTPAQAKTPEVTQPASQAAGTSGLDFSKLSAAQFEGLKRYDPATFGAPSVTATPITTGGGGGRSSATRALPELQPPVIQTNPEREAFIKEYMAQPVERLSVGESMQRAGFQDIPESKFKEFAPARPEAQRRIDAAETFDYNVQQSQRPSIMTPVGIQYGSIKYPGAILPAEIAFGGPQAEEQYIRAAQQGRIAEMNPLAAEELRAGTQRYGYETQAGAQLGAAGISAGASRYGSELGLQGQREITQRQLELEAGKPVPIGTTPNPIPGGPPITVYGTLERQGAGMPPKVTPVEKIQTQVQGGTPSYEQYAAEAQRINPNATQAEIKARYKARFGQ